MYYQYITSEKARKISENNIPVYRLNWSGDPVKTNPNSFYLKLFNQIFLMEIPSERFEVYTKTSKAIIYANFIKGMTEDHLKRLLNEYDFTINVRSAAGFLRQEYKHSFKNQFEEAVIADVLAYIHSEEFKNAVTCSSN